MYYNKSVRKADRGTVPCARHDGVSCVVVSVYMYSSASVPAQSPTSEGILPTRWRAGSRKAGGGLA